MPRLPETAEDTYKLAATSGFWLVLALAVLVSLRFYRTREFHVTVVALVLASMVGVPLLRTHGVSASVDEREARVAEHEMIQKRAEAVDEAQGLLKSSWDPRRDPLRPQAGSAAKATSASTMPVLVPASQPPQPDLQVGPPDLTTTDTDGDGLSDFDEADWHTDINVADTDGDGLSDGVEVHKLGLAPTLVDTDGDSAQTSQCLWTFSFGRPIPTT